MKECGLLLSSQAWRYFGAAAESTTPTTSRDRDHRHYFDAIAINIQDTMSFLFSSVISLVRYEYQLCLDVISSRCHISITSNNTAIDAMHTSLLQTAHMYLFPFYAHVSKYEQYLAAHYHAHLGPTVGWIIDIANLIAYYISPRPIDNFQLHKLPSQAVQTCVDMVMAVEAMQEVFGDYTHTVVTTIIYVLLLIVCVYIRKVFVGFMLLMLTIALLPLLIGMYAVTKLLSWSVRRLRKKKPRTPVVR